jgi:hypothetical protein
MVAAVQAQLRAWAAMRMREPAEVDKVRQGGVRREGVEGGSS